MQEPIRVAAVEYLNTLPFVYGLRHTGLLEGLSLSLAPPSGCAEMLRAGEVDLALVPVAALPSMPHAQVVSDYCIGATGAVETVCVLSMIPIARVQRIFLDGDSRTSAGLARILARNYWDIATDFEPLPLGGVEGRRHPEDAYLLIGDKVFEYARYFEYRYDLGEVWASYTEGLPFVFAVWAANRALPDDFLSRLESALGYGVAHVEEAIRGSVYGETIGEERVRDYLAHRISYSFDTPKREALARYLKLLPVVSEEVAPGGGRVRQHNEEQHDNYIL